MLPKKKKFLQMYSYIKFVSLDGVNFVFGMLKLKIY